MSEADGSSATIKSNAGVGVQVAGGWREGVVVLAIILAPVALAVILTAAGILALAGWQIVRGLPFEMLAHANIQFFGQASYIAASWIAVAAAWLWSSRRGLRR